MKYTVTGCSGFIGSNLVDRLLANGHKVVGIDNLSTGRIEFLNNAIINKNFEFAEGDILDQDFLNKKLKGSRHIYHLSANADVRFGLESPSKDINQNTIGTFNVLEAMRLNGISEISFSSTGSVYGEAELIPTPEDAPFPIQTSLYGASKLAGEGLISAYCEGFNFRANIFRFVGILGERYTHGHVYDFFRKLSDDKSKLEILGNGKQKKSYLYVQDCIDAMLLAESNMNDKTSIYNLGIDSYCNVIQSAKIICDELNVDPEFLLTGGDRGWIGDNPFIYLETKKIRSLGWEPKFSIEDALRKTVAFLKENTWVFK